MADLSEIIKFCLADKGKQLITNSEVLYYDDVYGVIPMTVYSIIMDEHSSIVNLRRSIYVREMNYDDIEFKVSNVKLSYFDYQFYYNQKEKRTGIIFSSVKSIIKVLAECNEELIHLYDVRQLLRYVFKINYIESKL